MTLLCVLIVTSHRFLDFIDIKPDSSTCSNHFIQFFNFFTHHFSLPPKQFENNSPHTSHDITPSIHDWFQNTLILLQNNHLNAFFFCFFVFVFLCICLFFFFESIQITPSSSPTSSNRPCSSVKMAAYFVEHRVCFILPKSERNSQKFKIIQKYFPHFPPFSLSLSLPVYPFQISVVNWMKFVTNYPIQKLKTKET